MSSGVILVIAIVIVVALAVMLVVTTSGRRDRNAAVGVLSRETQKRDKSTAGLGVTLAGAGGRTGTLRRGRGHPRAHGSARHPGTGRPGDLRPDPPPVPQPGDRRPDGRLPGGLRG